MMDACRALGTTLLMAVLGLAMACEAEVIDGSGGANGGVLDAECYDACLAKGVSESECAGYCTKSSGKGGSEKGATGAGGKSGSSGTNGSTGTASTGGFDVQAEKSCIQCWEEQSASSCSEEFKACEQSLACVQLRNCPFNCVDKEACLDECNQIIPSGLAPLTALAQCMLCGAGPCAASCADSVYQAYCQ